MKLNDYMSAARGYAMYPESHALTYPALGLTGEAGEVADKVKKVIRDGTEVPREEIAKEVGDVLWYLANLAWDLGIGLEEIAQMNLDKLADRKKRNVIGGSGDNR